LQAMNFTHKWVLITGASSGIGLEMAKQLAEKHQANLILVARREAQLLALKHDLEQRTGVQCHVIVADLSIADEVERVYQQATQHADIYGIILNAGATHFGEHNTLAWPDFEKMLALNVTSVVRLLTLFTPYLKEKNQAGGMMVTSSMAGLFPVPYQSAYAGTKAFLTNFAQSLALELHQDNLSITVFSPGGIKTDFTANTGLVHFQDSPLVQSAEACAFEGIMAMKNRKTLAVPGGLNRLQLFMSRFVPRKLSSFLTLKAYAKALAH
jgi:uncharacterized protein